MIHNLDRLLRLGVQVEVRWVKGHDASTGNARADALATTAKGWFKSHPWPKDSTTRYAVVDVPTVTARTRSVKKKRTIEEAGIDARRFEESNTEARQSKPGKARKSTSQHGQPSTPLSFTSRLSSGFTSQSSTSLKHNNITSAGQGICGQTDGSRSHGERSHRYANSKLARSFSFSLTIAY